MRLLKVCLVALLLAACLAATVVRADEAATEVVTEAGDKTTFTADETAALESKSESFEFQAEVHRLMDIIINSLYSKREIFLRELISNSADALDKIKYLTLTNQTTLDGAEKLEVRISFDKDAKTLTIRDTGVGMTRDELKRNLGIVAKSGTTEFVEKAASGDLSLIGQFGVGFYSVYLAADKVTVVSKSVNDTQHVWQSEADKTFTIAEDPRGNTLGRGTQVTLHLKDDALEFANEHELKKLVKRYSEFINYPIYLQVTKSVEKEVPDEEATRAAEEAAAEKEREKAEKEAEKEAKIAAGETVEEGDEDVEVSDDEETTVTAKTKKVTEQVQEWERVNDVKAIWTRAPRDITDDEYTAFFRTLVKDETVAPLQKIHFTAEGEITFRSILYVPKKAPSGLYDKFYEKSTSLRLYVRRVLISDEFEDFLPRYLNFVKGVVDSEDLPLNVSRETLAQSRVLKVMAKKITRKVLELLKRMADAEKKTGDEETKAEEKSEEEAAEVSKDAVKEEDQYAIFWKEFGKSVKLGCIDDRANKAKLAKLLRYQTTKSEGKLISLEEYVDRMDSKQKSIYYITGENIETVKNSPFIERLVSKNLEVVYMVDALDEYLVQSLTEFDGTPLQSITKEGLKLGDEDKLAAQKEAMKPLTEWLSGVYGDRVEKVTVSNRIATSPCVLVSGQYGWSANMERIMKAQTFANADEATWLHSKKTMEINPRHPIIKELSAKVADLKDAEGDAAKPTQLVDLANLLFDSALLSSGFQMRDTADFSRRIQRVISNGLQIDPSAEVEPEAEDAAEEEAAAEGEEAPVEEAADENAHDEL